MVIARLRNLLSVIVAVGIAVPLALPATAQDKFITVASTTSTENSGLFGHLLPQFEDKTGIEVRVVAVGTGQAIDLAKRGDADVLLVHYKPAEVAFVEEGYGVERVPVMYNDYVIVGPASDPAGIAGMEDAAEAFRKIAEAEAPFASRGDNSGTNKKELDLWEEAEVDPKTGSGTWYRETGSGMGPTLNTAAGMNAHALTDRGTWIAFDNKQDLEVLAEGDKDLFNQYGVILVNPKKYEHIKADKGQTFIDWVTGPEGQEAIADFKLKGQQLFFPNASEAGA